MTYQEAYIDGFCKAAEAAGIDPIRLYKQAAPAKLGIVGRAVKGVKRFGELLTGARVGRLAAGKAYNAAMAYNGRMIRNRLLGVVDPTTPAPASVLKLLKTRLKTIATGLRTGGTYGTVLQKNAPLRDELHQVLAARLAAGGAVAGGLGLAGAGAYNALAED